MSNRKRPVPVRPSVNQSDYERLRDKWWAVRRLDGFSEAPFRKSDAVLILDMVEGGVREDTFFEVAVRAMRVPVDRDRFLWTNMARSVRGMCDHFEQIRIAVAPVPTARACGPVGIDGRLAYAV